jgi:hypothetical protein
MKNKNLIILGAVFIVLIVIAYFLTSERGEKTTSYKLDKKIFVVDSSKVDKIEILLKGKKVTFSKTGSEWVISEPFNYKAQQPLVLSMVSDLKNFNLESIVSKNMNNQDKFGFIDTAQAQVTVYESGQNKGSFLIGGQGPGFDQSYIKKIGGNEIYLANKLTKTNFYKDNINDWRDKAITSVPKEQVNSIEFNSAGESFTILKDTVNSKYKIGADSVNSTVIDGVLNYIQNLNAQTFKDTTLADDTKYTDKVKVNWGSQTTIFNYLKVETTPVKYLLKISGINQVFEFDENTVKNLLKTRKEFTGK